MVFNAPVLIGNMAKPMSDDKKLIADLGGPAAVAELLGYKKAGGVQRVQNWTVRGIPPKVKLEHPAIFLAPPGTARPAPRGPA